MTETPHANIYAAVVKAMGQMKRLAKDSRNAEQKYDFASIDDFLAMTGPIMAQNGLFIHMDESAIEPFERQGKYGLTFWLRITFSITVFHESGTSLPTVSRTVEVIRTGAQSFGSAQSYALKQFQRGLFNIPTGDKDDADFAEKGEGVPIAAAQQAKPSQQSKPQGNTAKARALADEMINAARKFGAQAVTAHANYQRDIAFLETASLDDFERVIAALNPPAIEDEIPYER
jgi:hypothetical protein